MEVFSCTILMWTLFAQTATAAPPDTRPVEGLRRNTPTTHAFRAATIIPRPGQAIDHGVLVIRDGVILAMGSDVQPPADARIWDLTDKTIYPGLIDAFSETDVNTDGLARGAPSWNDQVRPQLQMAEYYQADAGLQEKLRSQGITARLVAPRGGILKGGSALVATGQENNSRSLLKANVAQHLRLTVPPGRGRRNYPNSPMGALALARQTLYDAVWYLKAWQAHGADSRLPRPERNDALAALTRSLDGRELWIMDASNELFVLRCDRFAREFGLDIAVLGSGHEYRRLDAIRDTGRPLIVPVHFPKPPHVGSLEASMNVRLEDLMHWDLAPENPARLVRAGVPIALTTHGLSDPKSFLANVRQAVKRGLPAEEALKALTTSPAELLNVSQRMGALARGKIASFVITDGDLFAEKTRILETWVDGQRHVITRSEEIDWRGAWTMERQAGGEGWLIELQGEPRQLNGVIRPAGSKPGGKEEQKLSKIGLRDARLGCQFPWAADQQRGVARLTAVAEIEEGKIARWSGQIAWPDGQVHAVVGKRREKVEEKAELRQSGTKPDAEGEAETRQMEDLTASCQVNYPLGAFGRASRPDQPETLAVRGATIWTAGKAGVIENGTLLIVKGRVAAVGVDVEVPSNALIIDAQGKHVAPGIIDCHSHIATDGGINESTQAITAEVRVGDFINADDIAIYRQLAGGVTCANILHGSSNPIGGQNQVIKFRWGETPRELKMSEAPGGIKFALGENVKQSNWGDEFRTRYPQTRMGVEQIIRDAFHAAANYQARWRDWDRDHRGAPPRRDLELQALSEVLQGRRWIHCHSYRQDEILALMRTLEDFQIRIGTFQHILEGYKVADAMAKHGAMGSAFSDWWAYKFEVYDAIPYNGALMHRAGVVVSYNSDDRELARHLNQEAAKAVKYGGLPETEALKFVTLNPARQLRIDAYVGSLEPGKQADFAIWSGPPLSNFSRCEQTWIDGRKYFDLLEDQRLRKVQQKIRNTLIQKILKSGLPMRKPGERDKDHSDLWPREDLFCHRHGHGDADQAED